MLMVSVTWMITEILFPQSAFALDPDVLT